MEPLPIDPRMESERIDPRTEYNRKWQFFYVLSGYGMKIYKVYHYGLGVEIYSKLFEHLVTTGGCRVERGVPVPMYWEGVKTAQTCDIPLLINGHLMVDVYSKAEITQVDRDYLKKRMQLTHIPYGIVMNFASDKFYSDWFFRDPTTGVIEKIKLI